MSNELKKSLRDTVFIVRESNILDVPDLIAATTVWACVGSRDNYDETGTKVAGPIPGLFAEQVVEGLAALFGRLGYVVVVEVAADD